MRFLPLLALIAAVHAYAVFDDVIPPEPQWTVPPLGAVPGDAAVIYRIVRAGDDRAWIEAQSRTNAALALRWVVPGYCDEPAELALAPNASARAAIRLKNCDHGLFSAAVLAPGQAQPRRPDAQPTAYGVTASVEDAGFAAHLLAYTLAPAAAGGIDLHLRHSGDRPVHLDWRVVGRPALVTPRLHVLPGRTAEVVLAGVATTGKPA